MLAQQEYVIYRTLLGVSLSGLIDLDSLHISNR